MSNQTYYVKIRGRVLGPFNADRLTEMVKQGKLSRVHMLSADGDNWQKANEFPELFQVAAQSKANVGNTTAVESKNDNQQSPPAAQEEDVWHYGINNDSFGPVSPSVIVELIGTGQLTEHDLVWREGMGEWTKAASVPQFSNILARNGKNASSADLVSGTTVVEMDLMAIPRILGSQSSWVTFICVNTYLLAATSFFVFIAGLVRGGKESDPVLITVALIAMVYTVLFSLVSYYFQRCASIARRFAISKQMTDLTESMDWLRKAWQLIGVMLIILWISVAISIVYSFTLTQALMP